MAEIEDVTIRPQAADDFGAGRGVNGLSLGADGDFAVIPDAEEGLLAPDIGPPRTGGGLAQDGTVLSQGAGASGLRGGAQFAMDFVLVGMEPELVEQAVGRFQIEDVISGEQRGQAFDQLKFFIVGRITEENGFIALQLAPAGHAGPP